MTFDFSISTERLKHILVFSLCAVVAGYFLVHSLVGDKGFVVMTQLEYQLAAQRAALESVQKERVTLENRARLLKSESLDLDLLDERSRAVLGYTKPNEYVIILDPQK